MHEPLLVVQERSERLSAHLGALADALYDGRVAEEPAARLLATASTAVAQALALDLLFEPPGTVAPATPEPMAGLKAPARRRRRIRLAA